MGRAGTDLPIFDLRNTSSSPHAHSVLLWVKSVEFSNRRLPVNFRYALLATEIARRCNNLRLAQDQQARRSGVFAASARHPPTAAGALQRLPHRPRTRAVEIIFLRPSLSISFDS